MHLHLELHPPSAANATRCFLLSKRALSHPTNTKRGLREVEARPRHGNRVPRRSQPARDRGGVVETLVARNRTRSIAGGLQSFDDRGRALRCSREQYVTYSLLPRGCQCRAPLAPTLADLATRPADTELDGVRTGASRRTGRFHEPRLASAFLEGLSNTSAMPNVDLVASPATSSRRCRDASYRPTSPT